jgi:sugar/nucleoside kinase (ribokinase family)|tara:strand:- start:2037 stop:3053 length:1017 start_codon:yes stop_codon:yes gene_type:complete
MTKTHSIDLIGVGSPIVDSLAKIDEAFLSGVDGEKGGMVLVDEGEMATLLKQVTCALEEAPGGAAGNTAFAVARLGLRTAFLGKVGNDASAQLYSGRFASVGGDGSRLIHGDMANGRCLSLITPDGARTMRTYLGAAATLRPDEITPAAFEGCRHAHIEGYLLFNDDLMQAILDAASQAQCTISLDLGSFEVVRACRGRLEGILREYVDIVLANEEEAAALIGEDMGHTEMAEALGGYCPISVLKVGAEGALIHDEQKVLHRIAPVPASKVVDTTAAGDLWAAGFLHSWLKGRDLATCGHHGSFLAAEVVQLVGTILPIDRWVEVVAELDAAPDPDAS